FRWIWIMTFVLSVLAAYGAHHITLHYGSKLVKSMIFLVMAAGVLIFMGLVISPAIYNSLAPLVQRLYEGLAGASTIFPHEKAFYSYQFNNVLIFALMLVA